MIISNVNYPLETVNTAGVFVTIFLITSIIISLLLTYTRYWNKYNSNIIDTCSYPMLVIFIEIVIFKIILII